MNQLQPVAMMYPQVKEIAAKIRKLLKSIVPVKGLDFPINEDFTLFFHDDDSFDIYVIDSTLFIPYMEKDKLVHLQAFFDSENLPCAIEHEVQHLLDVQHSIKNDYYITEELFEERASEMELQCALLLEGTTNDKFSS